MFARIIFAIFAPIAFVLVFGGLIDAGENPKSDENRAEVDRIPEEPARPSGNQLTAVPLPDSL